MPPYSCFQYQARGWHFPEASQKCPLQTITRSPKEQEKHMHVLGGKQDQLLFSLLFHPPWTPSDSSRRKVWIIQSPCPGRLPKTLQSPQQSIPSLEKNNQAPVGTLQQYLHPCPDSSLAASQPTRAHLSLHILGKCKMLRQQGPVKRERKQGRLVW